MCDPAGLCDRLLRRRIAFADVHGNLHEQVPLRGDSAMVGLIANHSGARAHDVDCVQAP